MSALGFVVGLGLMGAPMAVRLARQGRTLEGLEPHSGEMRPCGRASSAPP